MGVIMKKETLVDRYLDHLYVEESIAGSIGTAAGSVVGWTGKQVVKTAYQGTKGLAKGLYKGVRGSKKVTKAAPVKPKPKRSFGFFKRAQVDKGK
jgi:hypothetical protein